MLVLCLSPEKKEIKHTNEEKFLFPMTSNFPEILKFRIKKTLEWNGDETLKW